MDEDDSVGGQPGSMIGDGVRRWDAELVILSVKLKVKEMWLAWTRAIALEVSLGL